jgi:hypothetical protein
MGEMNIIPMPNLDSLVKFLDQDWCIDHILKRQLYIVTNITSLNMVQGVMKPCRKGHGYFLLHGGSTHGSLRGTSMHRSIDSSSGKPLEQKFYGLKTIMDYGNIIGKVVGGCLRIQFPYSINQ